MKAPPPSSSALRNPFGAASRRELLDSYFEGRAVSAAEAWRDVYKLLLWIDPTTALAHCYESDKSQPGRHWYSRSLAFHAFLCRSLGCDAQEVAAHIDWLFKRAHERLVLSQERTMRQRSARAIEQRAPYHEMGMPKPFNDPELRAIVGELAPTEGGRTQEEILEVLRDIRLHIAAENKRKNLLGEGFEDTIAAVLRRLEGGAPAEVKTQQLIEDLDGFREPRAGEKRQKVDLWVKTDSGRRILATAKWSVRADREKQLADDYRIYVDCNAAASPFEYVFLTNEFDAARLVANCDRMEANRALFDAVVHVCPDALLAAHGLTGELKTPETEGLLVALDKDRDSEVVEQRRSAERLPELVRSGRLMSLATWLADVGPGS